ncbi:uncharacterized protein NPIL_291041 [Nephila pilipes]|uniref:Uncharacterized protein n=1 Tax=Nephila pilipes TaxID=299642 RepID=A0A8X6T6U6_NEPPI|nr:uncharacterized protein NPIL_291041 [Nephila pilipes]
MSSHLFSIAAAGQLFLPLASKSKTRHLTKRSIPIGAFLLEKAELAPSLTMRYPPKHDLYEPISNAAYGFLADPPPRTFPLPLRKMAKFIVPPCKTPHDEVSRWGLVV